MSGRVITGVLSDYYSWRVSVIILGIFALVAAIIFLANIADITTF